MSKLIEENINFIIQRLDSLNDMLTVHEINEINKKIGLEELDENLDINNYYDYNTIFEQYEKMLRYLASFLEEADIEVVLEIAMHIEPYTLNCFYSQINDAKKEEIIKSSITPYEHKYKILMSITDEEKKINLFNTINLNLYDENEFIESIKSEENILQLLKNINEYTIYSIIQKFKSDENRLKAIEYIKNPEYKAEAITHIQDDNIKLGLLEDIPKGFQNKIIISLKNDENKKKFIETKNDYREKMEKYEIIKSLNSDDLKIQYCQKLDIEKDYLLLMLNTDEGLFKALTLFEYSETDKFDMAINKIKSDEYKCKILKEIQNNEYREKIICSLTDEDKKMQFLDLIQNENNKMFFAYGLKKDANKIKIIEKLENDYNKLNLIKTIEDDIVKLKAIEHLKNEQNILNAILYIKDENIRFNLIDKLTSIDSKKELIKKFENDEFKLKGMLIIQDKEFISEIRKLLKIETIQKNRKQILQLEGITEDIDEKVKILIQMEKDNSSLYNTIDFRLLDKDIMSSFTKEQIKQIICYPDIEQKIIHLKESAKNWNLFQKIFNIISQDSQNWDVKTSRLLKQLNSSEYQELINNISNTEEIDIQRLIKIMQFPNYFKIKTLDDLKNYSNIKKNVCDIIIRDKQEELEKKELFSILQMNDIDQLRFAILQKLYGQDLDKTQEIIEKFGTDIDKLESSSDEVLYVKALKEIMETNDFEQLKKYYYVDKGIEEGLIDIIAMENRLKYSYGKTYNKDLLKIQNLEKGEIEGTLKAGTNFKMLITSVSPYAKNSPQNFALDWNRNQITSRGFCCSYISNDMIATANIPHLCYGFSKMAEDSLMLSGPTDIFSNTKGLEARAKYEEKYYSAENQIDYTIYNGIGSTYNEMVFKRQQDGEKKQPDYIVVFKENGIIHNIEKAQKAQKQWKKIGKELPIVVIDKDECARANRAEIEKMMKDCKTKENYKRLIHKVLNNCKWNSTFEEYSFKIQELETHFNIKKIEDFFEECYYQTTPVSRQRCANIIQKTSSETEYLLNNNYKER